MFPRFLPVMVLATMLSVGMGSDPSKAEVSTHRLHLLGTTPTVFIAAPVFSAEAFLVEGLQVDLGRSGSIVGAWISSGDDQGMPTLDGASVLSDGYVASVEGLQQVPASSLLQIPAGESWLILELLTAMAADSGSQGTKVGYVFEEGVRPLYCGDGRSGWVPFRRVSLKADLIPGAPAAGLARGSEASGLEHSSASPGPLFRGVGPNPTADQTKFHFMLGRPGTIHLTIYDARGRLVRRLLSDQSTSRDAAITWDGRDEEARGVANGVYFAQISMPGLTTTTRVLLLR